MTVPTMMADSFMMATLFPAAAILPMRPAEPVSWERMVENVSDCGTWFHQQVVSYTLVLVLVLRRGGEEEWPRAKEWRGERGGE